MSELMLDRSESPVRRDQPPKLHGCTRAEFVVDPSTIPGPLRVGLFSAPATDRAMIQFPNGCQTDDNEADAHCMAAIKLLGVSGRKPLDDEADSTTHDFMLVDYPYFFIADAIAYARLSVAISKAENPSLVHWSLFVLPIKARGLATVAILHILPWRVGLPRKLVRFVGKRFMRYWSNTPYRLGLGRGVKDSAISQRVESAARDLSPDSSRDATKDTPIRGGASFQFAVQVHIDVDVMTVEEATVEWDERTSPYVTVAQIVFPPQDSESVRGGNSARTCRSPRGTHSRTTARWAASTGPACRSTARSRRCGTSSTTSPAASPMTGPARAS